MGTARQLVVTLALVAVVAIAAVAANLALLRSTEDSSDPVGHLSPRVVFSAPTEPAIDTTPSTTGRQDESEPDD